MAAIITIPSRFYTNLIDAGVGVASASVNGTLTCLETIFAPEREQHILRNGIEWSLGVPEYRRAVEAFRRRPPIPVYGGCQIVDMRPLSERFGEFTGHMINGACRVGATAIAAIAGTAFTVGTLSNARSWDADTLGEGAHLFQTVADHLMSGGSFLVHRLPESSQHAVQDFHRVACAFASGMTTLGSYLTSFGWTATKFAAARIQEGFSLIKDNPTATCKTLGIGAALYLTTSSIGRAERATSNVRKVAHIATAILGIGLAAAVYRANPSL